MTAAPPAAPAPPPEAPPAEQQQGGEEAVETLKAMFPDYDGDVLQSVLAMSDNNIETAIQQLLEMNNTDAPPPDVGAMGIDSDEELAHALFKQFADDLVNQLGVPVPEDVQNDPERYEAFVRTHFERELSRPDSQLTARATAVAQQRGGEYAQQYEQRGGSKGFLDRMRGMKLGGSTKKVSILSVDQGAQPLLLAEHGGEAQERV